MQQPGIKDISAVGEEVVVESRQPAANGITFSINHGDQIGTWSWIGHRNLRFFTEICKGIISSFIRLAGPVQANRYAL